MSLMNKIHRLFHLISPVKALPMNAEVSFFEFFQSLLHHFVNSLLINVIALHFFLPFPPALQKPPSEIPPKPAVKLPLQLGSYSHFIYSFHIHFIFFTFFLTLSKKYVIIFERQPNANEIRRNISPPQKSQNYQHLTQYLTLSKFTI